MFGYVAEDDGALVGLVHALVHPTTWAMGPNCYLEDLFVDPGARGSGVGRALIEAVVAEARTRGADAVYWHTQAFNGPGPLALRHHGAPALVGRLRDPARGSVVGVGERARRRPRRHGG